MVEKKDNSQSVVIRNIRGRKKDNYSSGFSDYKINFEWLLMDNVVLDTNCLISSLKRTSVYYPIWRDFMLGKYCLCFTDDILDEYQEIIEQCTGSPTIASNVISAILNRSNILHVEVYYHFDLIKADRDDNKFVDCAIKSAAKYIVSNDRHFDILKTIPFPPVNIIDIDRFLEELKRY